MPRRNIPFTQNTYHHIYNRGINRERIFLERDNYLYFLRGLKTHIQPVAAVLAYCLMPNHYHLVVRIEQPKAEAETSEVVSTLTPFSHAMKNFLISFTKGMNKRYSRRGTLFEGAFKSKPVGTYEYLLHLCIYIHANPVKDGMTADPADWPYSNYLEWLGERQGSLVDREFVNAHFPVPAEYKSLVLDYLKTRQLPDDVRRYLETLDG